MKFFKNLFISSHERNIRRLKKEILVLDQLYKEIINLTKQERIDKLKLEKTRLLNVLGKYRSDLKKIMELIEFCEIPKDMNLDQLRNEVNRKIEILKLKKK